MFIPILPSFPLKEAFQLSKPDFFEGEYWKSSPSEKVYLYSRGKWALQALAESHHKSCPSAKKILFIPEYYCESSLGPLRSSGFCFHFYKLQENLEPNLDHLRKLIEENGPPPILIFVHYFGIPLNLEPVSRFCKEWGITLVEDGAHSLGPTPGIGGHGHPVIYTPWKFIPSMEGALLVMPDASVSLNILNKGDLRGYPWKWIAKRKFFDFLVQIKFPLHKIKYYGPSEYSGATNVEDSTGPFCQPFFQAFLQTASMRFDLIAKTRENNFYILDTMLREASMDDLTLLREKPSSFCPYLYPLRLSGEISWKVMTSLAQDGIPALPWSELSPEVIHSTECQGVRLMAKEIITLPIHHSLTEKEMVWMGKRLINTIRKFL